MELEKEEGGQTVMFIAKEASSICAMGFGNALQLAAALYTTCQNHDFLKDVVCVVAKKIQESEECKKRLN